MITVAEAEKLGSVRAAHPCVLSLYLTVPLNPAYLRGLLTDADDLIAAAESAAGRPWRADPEARRAIRDELQVRGRDWLGRTVAVFASGVPRLFQAFALPGPQPDKAVLGVRPHIRPLLAVIQQHPAYEVVVVDRQHAWLFHVDGEETQTVIAPTAASVRSASFGGWAGLETYRMEQRAAGLARRHYRDTAAMLEAQLIGRGDEEPLVIGGHHEGIQQLLGSLHPDLRKRFAGSFAADTHTLTPARARELAAPLASRWAGQRAERIAGQILALPPRGDAATGVEACLEAVNTRAAETLIVPDSGLVRGYECSVCGWLSVAGDNCPHPAAALPVPDLIDEMVIRTLENGGQVYPIHHRLTQIAARLRYPIAG